MILQKHCSKCGAVLEKRLEASGEFSRTGEPLCFMHLKCPNRRFKNEHDDDYVRDHWDERVSQTNKEWKREMKRLAQRV